MIESILYVSPLKSRYLPVTHSHTGRMQVLFYVAILVRLWSTWSEPYTDVLHNSSHTEVELLCTDCH